LLAFLFVTVLPLLLLYLATTSLLGSRLEEASRRQLDAGLLVAETRLGEERERARQRIAAAVDSDLPRLAADDANPARAAARPPPAPPAPRGRGVRALALVGGAGRAPARLHGPGVSPPPAPPRVSGAWVSRREPGAEGWGPPHPLPPPGGGGGVGGGQP